MKWIHRGNGRPSAVLGEEKTKKSKEFLLTSERPGVEDGITRGRRGAYTSMHMWYGYSVGEPKEKDAEGSGFKICFIELED